MVDEYVLLRVYTSGTSEIVARGKTLNELVDTDAANDILEAEVTAEVKARHSEVVNPIVRAG